MSSNIYCVSLMLTRFYVFRLLSVGSSDFWRADMCPTRIPYSNGRIAAALQIVSEGMGAGGTGTSAPGDKLPHDLSLRVTLSIL